MLELLAAIVINNCSWNDPGQNPYRRQPVEAVDTYNFSPEVKAELKKKMLARQYDEVVTITATSIDGYTNLRNMHYGGGGSKAPTVCRTVDRTQWGNRQERALIYCVGENCLAVPTVCNNVSQVDKVSTMKPETHEAPTGSTAPVTTEAAPVESAGVAGNGITGLLPIPLVTSPYVPLVASPVESAPSIIDTPDKTDLPVFWIPPYIPPPIITAPIMPVPTTPIPEPGTWALFALGLFGLVFRFSIKGTNK